MPRSGLHLLVGLVAGIAISLVGGLVLAGPVMLSHRHNLPFEARYGDLAVSLASRFGGGTKTSSAAQDRQLILAGRLAYIGSCSVCHGATGDGKGVFGTDTFPPATDLRSPQAKAKTDAQLYWIIKDGLSFTAMPGFGDRYGERDIWGLVGFVRQLQGPSRPTAINIATPSTEQLSVVNPNGNDVQRGAAVYFAQGCATCHGPVGIAPAGLALQRDDPQAADAIRNGRPGMPTYNADRISDAALADLIAFLRTIGTTRPGGGGGGQAAASATALPGASPTPARR